MNDPVTNFQNQIRQFETAISSYRGNDPLDLWYRYICWLEQNSNNDVENIFRKSVEHCLSLYEKYENYKQDIRMVKLWIKYIDFQPNPLNLYQILYQQGIGTSHSCFYIAWAHYFNTANALKQAESIYNLGKQLKAQPIEELETAQKNFRFSVAQRMLYNDSSSKKRTISSLAEQRQQITALSPQQGPQQSKRSRYDDYEYSPNRYQEQQPQQSSQNHQQQSVVPAVAPYNNYNNSSPHPEVHQFQKQEQQQTPDPQQSSSQQQNYYDNTQSSSDAGYVISSSLNYVYNQSAENGYTEEPIQQPNPVKEEVPEVTKKFVYEDGIQLPQNFVRHVKNNTDQWNGPLCLEEPYDTNRKCFYPKHIVYPGDGCEYSLEEVLARKWLKRVEENRQMEEDAKRKRQEEQERQEQHQRYMAEMARKQREDEERAKYEMEMYQRNVQQQQQQQYNQYQHNQNNYHYQYQTQHHHMKSYDYYHESNSQYYHHQQPPVPVPPQHPDNMYHQNYQHQHQYPHQHQHYQHPPPPHQQPHHPYPHPHQNVPQIPIPQQSQQSVIVNTKQYHEQNVQGHYQHQHQMQYSQHPQPPQQQPQPVADLNQSQYQQQNFDQYYNGNPQPILAQKVEVFEEPQPEEDDEYESEYERDEEDENGEEETESSETDQFQTPSKVQQKSNDVSGMGDDLEEQIEASTISFCSTATNGISTQKKITIKFRKEKPPKSLENTSGSSSPAAGHSNVPYPSTQKTKKRKQAQYTMLTSYDNENTTFMPSNNNSCSERPSNAVDDAELLLSFSSNHKSNDSTINSEFNRSFGNISFSTQDKTLVNNQFGSTPIRHSSSISKTSTPINSYKFLKKHESNISLQNDDSLCSFTADQNSFFQAENDEELQKSRLEKALKTVEDHMGRRDIDPFSSELCKALLVKLNFPNRQNTTDYKIINSNLPKLYKNQLVTFGGCSYQIEKEVGRGSYGAVYRGVNSFDGSVVALKYQKPPNSWELYICTEVKNRLKNSDILPGFMSISSAVIAPNASVLISEFSQYGSLLDINNRIRQATTKVMHESLVMHFSSEILNVCDYLHSCNIIHADIKPDNFLLMSIPSVESNVPSLRLIDFGCAIDMNLFEKGTEFRKIIQTDGFTCTEMLQGKPWSFQTDMFCVAGTIHVMLFGEYMQVVKKAESNWEIKQKFPRYLKKHVWSDIFAKLLNIKDKNHLPNLQDMRKVLNRELMGMENELIKNIRTLSNLMKKR